MACDPWLELEMTVAALHFDVSVAAISEHTENIRSVTGFCTENEKADQSWDRLMHGVNQHQHELLLEHILKPLKV